MPKPTKAEIRASIAYSFCAEMAARALLKPGDRVRVTKCPGGERTFTFNHWNGDRMVSKSGINDYLPECITKINGEKFTLNKPTNKTKEPTK